MVRRSALVLLAATPVALLAKERSWKDGLLMSVEIREFMTGKNLNRIDHRYLCTIGDGEFNYVVEYEKPLKLAVNEKIKFITEKDNLIILDADGKERQARVEKREHVR